MIYNLGDHSLLFKRLSIQLQNNFDSTLTVSDEYNLDLAKCIYRYLYETYHNILKIGSSDIDTTEYDIRDLVRIKKILSGMSDSSQSKNYDFNNDGEVTSEELTQLKLYLLGATELPSIQSESNRLVHVHAEDISRAYLDYARLYKDITLVPKDSLDVDLDKRIYDRNKINNDLVESINDITRFNIALWPISDNIIQYVFSDTVITPLSSLEDIAEMQKLLSNIYSFNYEYVPGTWDYNFSKACYTIQIMSKESNPEIICTGLCDLYVERYLRSQNEIRSTSYGHN